MFRKSNGKPIRSGGPSTRVPSVYKAKPMKPTSTLVDTYYKDLLRVIFTCLICNDIAISELIDVVQYIKQHYDIRHRLKVLVKNLDAEIKRYEHSVFKNMGEEIGFLADLNDERRDKIEPHLKQLMQSITLTNSLKHEGNKNQELVNKLTYVGALLDIARRVFDLQISYLRKVDSDFYLLDLSCTTRINDKLYNTYFMLVGFFADVKNMRLQTKEENLAVEILINKMKSFTMLDEARVALMKKKTTVEDISKQ